ncbi:hypothetical protein EGI24_04915 [Lacihabitans sp. CS3-21]|nr:hypothetical protein [Lacihabitans sp. CS3-21]
MNLNKEIASRLIVLFESCNQLKLLAEEAPSNQHLKPFAEQLYCGLNDLFLFQELHKFAAPLEKLTAKVIEFQGNISAEIPTLAKDQIENIKKNLIEIQNLIGNE